MVRYPWLDYLRAFITVLVVAHHSALAYATFSNFDAVAYIRSTSPVVDAERWIGCDMLISFNDIFFMPLMFLLSGLFVTGSVRRKGTKQFVCDRMKRLGIPFLVAVTLIIPIAYLPSFYIAHHSFNLIAFAKDYIQVEQWTVGPPWFIWLLLAFTLFAITIPMSVYNFIATKLHSLSRTPLLLFILLFCAAALSLIPLSLYVGQYTWTGFGPFDFQLNRVIFYFVFFLLGVCLGNADWETYFFRSNKLFNLPWSFWLLICLFFYVLIEAITYRGALFLKASSVSYSLVYDLLFVASCLATCFFFLSLFRQMVRRSNHRFASLSENAYGIYLLHYVFVCWLQFLLLPVALPASVKFLLVFVAALFLSWASVAALRKLKPVRQLI